MSAYKSVRVKAGVDLQVHVKCILSKSIMRHTGVPKIKPGANLRVHNLCPLTGVSESRLVLAYEYM